MIQVMLDLKTNDLRFKQDFYFFFNLTCFACVHEQRLSLTPLF